MSNLLSINIQHCESPALAIFHNLHSRENISYLIQPPNTITKHYHQLESISIQNSRDEVFEFFAKRQVAIAGDYKKNNNNRSIKKDTKLYQEAVISFGREQFEKHTPEQISQQIDIFCENFAKKYGCKILMSSLHLDEGHKSEGELLHNYHAHILIENYNFDTHKTCLQKLDYRKLQT